MPGLSTGRESMAKPGWYGVATVEGHYTFNDWGKVERFLKEHRGPELHKKFPLEKQAEEYAISQCKFLHEKYAGPSITGESALPVCGQRNPPCLSEKGALPSDTAGDLDEPPW